MRAKFQIDRVDTETRSLDGKKIGERIFANAVYGGESNAEDNQFSEATPSGKLEMYISNPKAFGFLEEGQKYYLDFTKADN